MNHFFKILSLITLITLFFGCDSDLREQNKEYQKEISKRQTNSFEYFKSTDEKIDNTFDKKSFMYPYIHIYIFLKIIIQGYLFH